jgi:endonuclease III related protein
MLSSGMHREDRRSIELYDRLLSAYGPQDWWPGRDDPFEVIVGAILTQRTTWTNAAQAIQALREAELLTACSIDASDVGRIEELVRPAGFFRAKAATLKAFSAMLRTDHAGDLHRLFDLPTDALRVALLDVRGIGDETADAVLLYAAGRPSFVIDAYTRRLLTRLGWIAGNESYRTLQTEFAAALPEDVDLFAEYHALIVQHGKMHCRARPRCTACALKTTCSYGATREADR